MQFKVQMRLGDIKTHMEEAKFQTPIEQGLEMTEQIIRCTPLRGTVKAYAQLPVTFACQSHVEAKNIASVRKYALTERNAPGSKLSDGSGEQKSLLY